MKTNRAKLSAMVKLGQRGALLASALCLGGMAQAQTTYNVAGLADFTGPFADIMKDMTGCRRAVLDWWSEEVGKAQGVALRIKDFDTRYDVAQVASLWRRRALIARSPALGRAPAWRRRSDPSRSG